MVIYITIKLNNGNIETSLYTKPCASHKYLSPSSCHDRKVIEAIPFSVLYRVKLISSSQEIFEETVKMYRSFLVNSGYSNVKINEALSKIRNLSRENMLIDEPREKNPNFVAALMVNNHPALSSLRKGWQAAKKIISLDKIGFQWDFHRVGLVMRALDSEIQ